MENEILTRLTTAISFLKDGSSFSIDGLGFSMIDKNTLRVTGSTRWSVFGNLTKSQVRNELYEVKDYFLELMNSSPELKVFVDQKRVQYSLIYDDSGKGGIGLCSEIDGVFKWEANLRD